jgi:hypothetical protein
MWIPKFILKIAREKAEADAKATSDLRVIQLTRENNELKTSIGALKNKLSRYIDHPDVSMETGDPVPTDKEKRRLYVSAVAGLHNEILRPKMMLMIAKVREALEREENSREQDLQLKGTAYALWEIIRWGNLMASEDQAYNAGQNPSVPEDKK